MNNHSNSGSGSPQDRREFFRGSVLSILLVVLILGSIGGGWWYLDYTEDDGLIYPNVSALGIDLSGLTPEEAAALLHERTDGTYSVRSMTIELPDRVLDLTPDMTGASVDVDALVKLAYDYGRGGSRWENTQARAQAALSSYQVDPSACLTLNEDAIRRTLEQAAAAAASTLTQPSVQLLGQMPDLEMTYEAAMAQTDVEHMQLVVTVGRPDRALDVQALMDTVLRAYRENRFDPISAQYQVTLPEAVDAAALLAQFGTAPVDSVLDTTDYVASQEILGYGFDAAALQAQIDAAAEGQVLTALFTYQPANVTKASIEATLFQDVLGSVSTNHTNESNRNTNLKLACQALNGVLVRPGEVFSYNATLGERTREKGYKAAGAFSGGKTIETVGGGICQVSSSLYYACLKADLEIVDRTCHGFNVSYVPYGMDATVSWGTLDFKFKNNTPYPIRIVASVSGGQVHIKLLGTDDRDYYVKMTYETVDGPYEGKVIYQDFPVDNKEGYKDGDVVQTAYTGRTVKTYRNKYSKATDELISSEYEATSRYHSRDKIIARVQQPTEPEGE